MRKLAFCIVIAILLLCGCEKEVKVDSTVVDKLNSAIDTTNSEKRFSGKYMLEFSFGENASLYYASGDIACDREEERLSAVFNHTYLGQSSKAANYFSDGKMVSVEDGEPLTIDTKPEEIFTKFPYCAVDKYNDSFGSIDISENASGKSYSFTRDDTKSLCDEVVGDDIYSLVAVLKKPQKDKTEYGKTSCIYTVANGKIVSCRYEFDIKLFDTPSVVDGYTPPEEEYTIKLHITAKVTYENFGDGVEIGQYSKN